MWPQTHLSVSFPLRDPSPVERSAEPAPTGNGDQRAQFDGRQCAPSGRRLQQNISFPRDRPPKRDAPWILLVSKSDQEFLATIWDARNGPRPPSTLPRCYAPSTSLLRTNQRCPPLQAMAQSCPHERLPFAKRCRRPGEAPFRQSRQSKTAIQTLFPHASSNGPPQPPVSSERLDRTTIRSPLHRQIKLRAIALTARPRIPPGRPGQCL